MRPLPEWNIELPGHDRGADGGRPCVFALVSTGTSKAARQTAVCAPASQDSPVRTMT